MLRISVFTIVYKYWNNLNLKILETEFERNILHGG